MQLKNGFILNMKMLTQIQKRNLHQRIHDVLRGSNSLRIVTFIIHM